MPLTAAIAIDLILGDPKEGGSLEAVYPPVLVGRLGETLANKVERGDNGRERNLGAAVWIVVVGSAVAIAILYTFASEPLSLTFLRELIGISGKTVIGLGLGMIVLVPTVLWVKSLFALRGLTEFCTRPLGRPMEEKRMETSKVVNRETKDLPDPLLNSALVESLAENTTDSVVSPMLFYGFLGLPGLVAYRGANTMDAVAGHKDRQWRYVGAFSAKVDHIFNIPGDWLTAALLSPRDGASPRVDLQDPEVTVPRSMKAISASLGVRLERRGSYVIGPELPEPTEADVYRAMRKVKSACYVAFMLAYAIIGVMAVVGWVFVA